MSIYSQYVSHIYLVSPVSVTGMYISYNSPPVSICSLSLISVYYLCLLSLAGYCFSI